jgi:hypothetical protein
MFQRKFSRIEIIFILLFSLRATRARVWSARIDSPLFNVKTYAAH